MFRNCLAASLRHLSRNRLYSAISVAGLAVGLCVALMAGLVIRNQYSYDHDLSGYERTYKVLMALSAPGMARQYAPLTLLPLAAQLPQQFPQVEAASLVHEEDASVLRAGTTSSETVYWVDPNLPRVLPLPQSAGDVAAALRTPDGLILSRSDARRFFGRDAPLGELLVVAGHPMVVRAVIQDRPANSSDTGWGIIASRASSFAPNIAKQADAYRKSGSPPFSEGATYVRLRSGADAAALNRNLSQFLPHSLALWSLQLVRIDRLNTHEGLHPGFHARMMMLEVLGVVVLLIAAINFVNLQTACAMLRAREVAIRALAGAGRPTLAAQFLGEALVHAAAAMLLAVALTEWLLPRVNAFLDAGARMDYRSDPWLMVSLTGATLLCGLLAGAWPAFVMSGFHPLSVLRGAGAAPRGVGLRQGLVALQFALLISLAICAGVVFRQRTFALHEALRMDTDQVLIIGVPVAAQNRETFGEEVRKLPGVRALAWAESALLGSSGFGPLRSINELVTHTKGGKAVSLNQIGADFDIFDFYGVRPLAGRLPAMGEARTLDPAYLVLNETAVRKLELGPPAQAVGKPLNLGTPDNPGTPDHPFEPKLLAVVPDFSLGSVAEAISPTIYYQTARRPQLINVRLAGRDIAETRAAIDALWNKVGNGHPLLQFFLDEHLERHYHDVLRQSQAFGICALIAVALSCVGLFALTAAAAQRRTKEIGIRKALGANTGDILRLLLWQFSQPVIWGSLFAWAVTAYTMRRWLEGFAYHIDLPLVLFPAATVAALMIALATVSTQSILVARARPTAALRYE